MDIKNCKPGHIFNNAVELVVTSIVLEKSGSRVVGQLKLFGKSMEYNWCMDITSETDVKIGTVLKMDYATELQKIHITQSGTVYTFTVTLSKGMTVDVSLTDEYISKYEPTENYAYVVDKKYRVGSRTVTTKRHGFVFGIDKGTVVDVVAIDEEKGYTIQDTFSISGNVVKNIGWVI